MLRIRSFRRLLRISSNHFYSSNEGIILGIETSCDDTGCAVIDTKGNILGEALRSQHLLHLNNGGIIPPLAQEYHRKNIESVVNEAVEKSKLGFENLSAVAVTVKPGLPMSLIIGLKYAKYLCRKYGKPLIPIHHMEAHALTARLTDKSVQFPFLVLLVSGGHCLLALVNKLNDFVLLGESIDDAPGEAFDKIARRLKLKNLPEFSKLSGGQAIELAAMKADNLLEYNFTIPMLHYKDCNFSFSGIKNQCFRAIIKEERIKEVPADGVIPGVYNLCAELQLIITRHLCHRLQRAMEFCFSKGLLNPEEQNTLVVSGGVACNDFIAKGVQLVADEFNFKFVRPPPKLCTDNGIMIAWNGVEKWRDNIDILDDFESVDIENIAPLGRSLIDEVKEANMSCSWVKLTGLNKPQKCSEQDVNKQEVVL